MVLVHFKRDVQEFALGSGCLLSHDVDCKPVILSVRKIIRQHRKRQSENCPNIAGRSLMKTVILPRIASQENGTDETNLNGEIDGTKAFILPKGLSPDGTVYFLMEDGSGLLETELVKNNKGKINFMRCETDSKRKILFANNGNHRILFLQAKGDQTKLNKIYKIFSSQLLALSFGLIFTFCCLLVLSSLYFLFKHFIYYFYYQNY